MWINPETMQIDAGAMCPGEGWAPLATDPVPDAGLTQQVVAGETVQSEDGWRRTWALVDKPLADASAAVAAAADRKARELRDKITAGISAAEMASWAIKRAEAHAYQTKGAQATDADAPMLAREAQARGCDMAALVAKVAAKSEALSMLEASIAGRCGAIQDAAKTAATVADLAAIDIVAGWPA